VTTTKVPRDAREVYLDDAGNPVAYCPVDGLGITDLQRAEFYMANRTRLDQLADRADEKTAETGVQQAVVCIDVDDPTWAFVLDILMPGFDWEAVRDRGERPVARGVVPRQLIEDLVRECYPAGTADLAAAPGVCVAVLAAGGISVLAAEVG
jgi:hypothetical protein